MGCWRRGRLCLPFPNSGRFDIAHEGMDYVLNQLSQSSTWRGLILIAGALGWQLSETHNEAIVAAALGLVGLINVFRKG
jgi:hypothetical protein